MSLFEQECFISYSHDDQPVIKELVNVLKSKYRVWVDFERGYNQPPQVISRALEKSVVFVCCLSKSYGKSGRCINELNHACDLGMAIVLLKLDNKPINEYKDAGFILDKFEHIPCYNYPDTWPYMLKSNILKDIKSARAARGLDLFGKVYQMETGVNIFNR